MNIDPITLAPIDPTLERVLAEIDARIALFNGAIDRRIKALTNLTNFGDAQATEIARIATDIARYGAAKAELIRLKEIL